MSDAYFTSARRTGESCGWTIRRITLRPHRRAPGGARPLYEPPTDVYETADRIVARVEIAGLAREALEVSVDAEGTILAIAGKREDPAAGSPRKYYNMEIECGQFARQISIPQPIDVEAVSASYADGFLEIVMPKAPPAAPRTRSVPIS